MPNSILTPQDTRRGIWVDFEGNKDRPPVVLGVFVDEALEQVVVDPLFADCAGRRHGCDRAAPLPEVALELVDRAVREERRIVSWSTHDLELLERALPDRREARGRFRAVAVSAIPTARRWRSIRRRGMTGRNRLERFREIFGMRLPEHVARGTVGPALRAIGTRLAAHDQQWADLTPGLRRKWKNVLHHNSRDLRDMAWVTSRTAERLAARRARRSAGSRAPSALPRNGIRT